jgi:hypothetical protein
MRKLGVSFGAKLELDIVVGEQPPAATEAVVVPQDVNLIMGDVEPIEDTSETTQDVLARGVEARPRRAGTLVVGGAPQGAPLLMQAIVYDFEHSPPACEDHVFEALVRALEEAKTRGLSRIAVRPLGTAHAGIEPAEFLRLLAQACYSCAELGTTLRKVHLLLPSPEELARYEGLLQQVVQARKG